MDEERFRRGLQLLAEDVSPREDALETLTARRRRRDVRRRMMSGLATGAVMAVIAVAVLQLRPGDEQPSPFGSPTSTPAPSSSQTVAYSFEGDVYLHEVSGSTRRITDDGRSQLVVLHATGRLWWSMLSEDGERSILWRMDLDSGERQALTEVAGWAQAMDIDPSGSKLAVMTSGERSQQRVMVVDALAPSASAEVVRRFPTYFGRGTSLEDEVSIGWSPDGERLLVVNTFIGTPPFHEDTGAAAETLLVLDKAGREVIPARHGTFGRWISDDAFVYRALGDGTWRVLSIGADVEQIHTDWPATGTRPAVSPDGKSIAMHVERAEPELPLLFVADLGTGRRLLPSAPEGLWTVWLDDGTVIATEVEACAGDCIQHWSMVARGFRVDVLEGSRSVFAVPMTYHARVASVAGDER